MENFRPGWWQVALSVTLVLQAMLLFGVPGIAPAIVGVAAIFTAILVLIGR